MNTNTLSKKEYDILVALFDGTYKNQRQLADKTGYSLGLVNKTISILRDKKMIDKDMKPTKKAYDISDESAPQNAIILAAGYGMRMVPINTETPKGLLEVKNEALIERMIVFLQEVGIKKIYVVVGFMKENYEFLIDKYGVELIVNSQYSSKNNLYSLKCAADYLGDTYIIPCDIWCKNNPFNKHEFYSWYMVLDDKNNDSEVKVSRSMELIKKKKNESGNSMIGISYITKKDAVFVKNKIKSFVGSDRYDDSFWEETLYEGNKMILYAKLISGEDAVEINTYEQLRNLDNNSNHLRSDALDVIRNVFNVDLNEINNIDVLKKGMTNRSFKFEVKGKKYIMRIPGEGTEFLINRRHEAEVYEAIKGKGICDDTIYLNPDNGYKITKYLEGVRTCNPDSEADLKICMKKLKEFHNMKLMVKHEFDVFQQINFYEQLWNGANSVYKDYETTKKHVFDLKQYINKQKIEKCLTHIDAVSDNFLFYEKNGKENVQLTDWEYSGMQDPHVDIAMFCIYSLYDKNQVDKLINIYFDNKCKEDIRIKIYCYIAACGLLWSNWCEYKRQLGIEFGEYSIRQYRYAKEYYRLATEKMTEV